MKQKKDESLRHPLVSPGTFLCTGNDCTRSRSRIWEGGGRCHFKQLNERKGARMHTWSTVQLTDSDHCSRSLRGPACHLQQMWHPSTGGAQVVHILYSVLANTVLLQNLFYFDARLYIVVNI